MERTSWVFLDSNSTPDLREGGKGRDLKVKRGGVETSKTVTVLVSVVVKEG